MISNNLSAAAQIDSQSSLATWEKFLWDSSRKVVRTVQWQTHWLLTERKFFPGSPRYIHTLIAGWNSPHMRMYVQGILAKDPLLGNMFEVTSLGLQVRVTSWVLEAHFGDTTSDTGKKSDLRVVPGVILKRLITSIFGVALYTHIGVPPVSVRFSSGVTPGAVLSFDLLQNVDQIESKSWKLAMFTGMSDSKKLALCVQDGVLTDTSVMEELRSAALDPRTGGVNFSSTAPLEHLAQWGDFRFALNTGIINPEKRIYQTLFTYPRHIEVQARIENRESSIVFVRNKNGELLVPWELLEEAVCQSITLAAQKYIFEPFDFHQEKAPLKKKAASKDTLITLSESISQIHRQAPMNEWEFLNITFRIKMTAWGAIEVVHYIVTPKVFVQEAELIMSGTICGTRISKTIFARALRA